MLILNYTLNWDLGLPADFIVNKDYAFILSSSWFTYDRCTGVPPPATRPGQLLPPSTPRPSQLLTKLQFVTQYTLLCCCCCCLFVCLFVCLFFGEGCIVLLWEEDMRWQGEDKPLYPIPTLEYNPVFILKLISYILWWLVNFCQGLLGTKCQTW